MMSTLPMSAFTEIRYSARLLSMQAARLGSTSVASCSALDRPQIIPPINCECAVRGLTIRPAANAPTMRGPRTSRVRTWPRTSTSSAPIAYCVCACILPMLKPSYP